MIIDAFIFYNELDILEMRLREYYDYVDVFILVEMPKTHTGKDKPLYYAENKARYSQWASKIHYVLADGVPPITAYTDDDLKDCKKGTWVLENYQRNGIGHALKDYPDNSIVMISDVDEFIQREYLPLLDTILPCYINGTTTNCSVPFISVEQEFFYYNFNSRKREYWYGTVLSYNGIAKALTPQVLRDNRCRTASLKKAGWHCSYFMTPEGIANKLQSFTHQEFNKEQYTNIEAIKERVSQKRDIGDRPNEDLLTVSTTNNVPRFHWLIDRCFSVGISVYTGEPFYSTRTKAVYESWYNDFNTVLLHSCTPSTVVPITVLQYSNENKENWFSAFYKNFYGLKDLYERFPTLPWYACVGCDTFINKQGLLLALDPYYEQTDTPLFLAPAEHYTPFKVGERVIRLPAGGCPLVMNNRMMRLFITRMEEIMEEWKTLTTGLECNTALSPDHAIAYGVFKYFGVEYQPMKGGYCHPPIRYCFDDNKVDTQVVKRWEEWVMVPKGTNKDIVGRRGDHGIPLISNPVCFHYCEPDLMRELYERKNKKLFPFE